MPELGEMVKPHPHFMLFATQNPAGAYGGRKVHLACTKNLHLMFWVQQISLADDAEYPPSWRGKSLLKT